MGVGGKSGKREDVSVTEDQSLRIDQERQV